MSSTPAPELPLALLHLALLALLFAVRQVLLRCLLKGLASAAARAVRAEGWVLCLSDRRTAATQGSCEPWRGGSQKAPVILPS